MDTHFRQICQEIYISRIALFAAIDSNADRTICKSVKFNNTIGVILK